MQRVHNYGSFLQAFALKSQIEFLGHECKFIDIKPGEKLIKEQNVENDKLYFLKMIDKHILKRIERYFFVKKRSKIFEEKLFSILELSHNPNYNEKFDIVVIGSDEVFNCIQDAKWGFSKQLLGEGLNCNKVITYAASCGYTTYGKIKEFNIEDQVKNALSNISEFSVRDKNTHTFIKELTGKDANFNIDPVFTMNYDEFIPNINITDDYVLIYGYDNRINDEQEINTIKKFAKERNLKTIGVGFYQRWCDENLVVDAFELLSYVKNAKYIITDTFHGSIFSIKYNKKFATIIRDSNKEKLYDLLDRFGVVDRQVEKIEDLSLIIEKDINYLNINNFISDETQKSIQYLKTNCEGCE